jgi:hypothetical protein
MTRRITVGTLRPSDRRPSHVAYYTDIGAGQSDFTWQAFAGVGYRFAWGDALTGCRHLKGSTTPTRSRP